MPGVKLAIFGATGATGLILVEQALDSGHYVVAFVRNPEKLGDRRDGLTIVAGELGDEALIERAVEGVDAVVSLLGPLPGSKGQAVLRGTKNFLAAMKRHGVPRLVMVSTASASDPDDGRDLKFGLLVRMVRLLYPAAYEDIVATADAVRAPLLRNGPKTGRVKVGYLGHGIVGTFLSRANMADFLLRQVDDRTYVRKSPAISDG